MIRVGPLALPVKTIEIIYDREDIFDICLDMKIPGMNDILSTMLHQREPQILVLNKDELMMTSVLCHLPPEIWKTNPSQDLLMFVGPGLGKLTEFFTARYESTPNQFEKHVCADLINIMMKAKVDIEERRKKNYIQYGSNSTST